MDVQAKVTEEEKNCKVPTSISLDELTSPDKNEINAKQNFRCGKCLKVPLGQVHQCSCDTLYCKVCFANMDRDGEACKYKKCEKKKMGDLPKIGRLIKNIMLTFKFEHKCEKDGESTEYTFEQLTKHLDSGECKSHLPYVCPHAKECLCPKKMSLPQLKEHLTNECNQVQVQCQFCEETFTKADYGNIEAHNCKERLNNLKISLQGKVTGLEKAKLDLEASKKAEKEDFERQIKELEAKLKQTEEKSAKVEAELHAIVEK
jgi:hypothetical protein